MTAGGSLDLGITIGTKCNFGCRHCLVDRELGSCRISGREVSLQIETINKYHPRSVIFTGGEPTLCIKEVKRILSSVEKPEITRFRMVTNGHFAVTPAAAEKTLKSLKGLSSVQMSYDRFHAEFVPVSHIYNLSAACLKLKLAFSIVSSIESPADILFTTALGLKGVPITLQKILPIGRAKKNKIAYGYKELELEVLKKKCPNLGGLVYNCGSGFTVCCAFLASRCDKRGYVHATPEEHWRSPFYKLLSEFSFGELLRMAGLTVKVLNPADSAPCALCSRVLPILLRTGIGCDGGLRD